VFSVHYSVTTPQRHHFYAMYPVPHRFHKLSSDVSVDEPPEDVDVVHPCGDARFLLLRSSVPRFLISSTSGMENFYWLWVTFIAHVVDEDVPSLPSDI
jgi:hypothetical protein